MVTDLPMITRTPPCKSLVFFNAGLEILAAVPTADGKGLYLLNLYRTRIDPPTGMLAGVLMGKVRDGIETGVKENLKIARERLAAAR
jgi:hypothetical protein